MVVVVSKDVSVPEGSDCSGQIVILEALAAGKAVIATRRPWMDEYLIDGQDLVIVEPGNHEALAQAINSLWSDPQKRNRIGISGRAKVVAQYTTKAFAQRLIAVMNSLL